MERYRLLFESVFKKKLSDADTTSYLENLTAAHPYFSVAQFYLLKLSENAAGYKQQAQKTAALFNNNYWLNFQLQEAKFYGDTVGEKISDPVAAGTATAFRPEADVILDTSYESATEVPGIQSGKLTETPAEPEAEPVKDFAENEAQAPGNPVAVFTESPANTGKEICSQTENAIEDNTVTVEPAAATDIAEAQHPFPVEDTAGESTATENNASRADAASIQTGENNAAENAPVAQQETIVDEDTAAGGNTAAFKISLPVMDNTIAADSLAFEPLHTTDYFASVGIKLSEEEKSADTLGKQLRSFTEWLKTMKKVHAGQVPVVATPTADSTAAENSIQKLAEKSNEEDQVLTEAMADVLLQQGKELKAIEILEKLSLLNPGKSTYFAAKINQIKEK